MKRPANDNFKHPLWDEVHRTFREDVIHKFKNLKNLCYDCLRRGDTRGANNLMWYAKFQSHYFNKNYIMHG